MRRELDVAFGADASDAAAVIAHAVRATDVDVLDGAAALAAWHADPARTPFQHPRWLAAWWRTFGVRGGATPVLLESAAYGGVRRVAWSRMTRQWAGVRVDRLEPLGQSDWLPEAFPGEFAGLPLGARAPLEARLAAYRSALDATLDRTWDELYVRWLAPEHEFALALRRWADERGLAWVRDGDDPAHFVATDGPESQYRAGLGEGARRAMYGKRRVAEALGLRYVERAPVAAALETLFDLHDARWEGGGMPASTRAFLRAVTDGRLDGVECRISLLVRGDRPVSASLNLQCAGVVWNLQGGFRPDCDPRLSPGKLHLGYELERAFAAAGMRRFEFLAGRGRNAEYKSAIATGWRPLLRVRIVRSRWWRTLLAARDVGRRVRRAAQRAPDAASTSSASPENSWR